MRALVLEQHDRRKEVCEALDMSFVRVKALCRIADEPLTMRGLTAHLQTDAPYTTIVVDDLEQRGLVRRAPHPADRRAKVVTATEEGRAAAARAEGILNEPPPSLLTLASGDLAQLVRIIDQLRH
ncbi:MarR family winged helix-turn-helix transcriptional regulator [Dactylosporangium fulvum]|uniref:MarR family transcriptional regulator n=1 Tax=Dactylosporangium fulvum TaxID=53359 RepID=A0ABY5VYN5_9ACTN|nr:MarR family transcriptional regulator [Dactylosporangium fulvum]UWP82236.1 MarR family transcriptional regulator [Dactylosporangium fulvum]